MMSRVAGASDAERRPAYVTEQVATTTRTSADFCGQSLDQLGVVGEETARGQAPQQLGPAGPGRVRLAQQRHRLVHLAGGGQRDALPEDELGVRTERRR